VILGGVEIAEIVNSLDGRKREREREREREKERERERKRESLYALNRRDPLCLIFPHFFPFLSAIKYRHHAAYRERAGDRSAGAITRHFGGNEGGIETEKACGVFFAFCIFSSIVWQHDVAGKRSRVIRDRLPFPQ